MKNWIIKEEWFNNQEITANENRFLCGNGYLGIRGALEEFQKEKPRSVRMSRHLYDLEKLMDTEYGKEALSNRELYDAIVEHRKAYYALKYVNYDSHTPSTINFTIPESAMEAWQDDYADMRRFFIYGESLEFDELMQKMRELQERVRIM